MNVSCKTHTNPKFSQHPPHPPKKKNLPLSPPVSSGVWGFLVFFVGWLFGFFLKLTWGWVRFQWQTEKNLCVLWDCLLVIHRRGKSVFSWRSSGQEAAMVTLKLKPVAQYYASGTGIHSHLSYPLFCEYVNCKEGERGF